MKTIHKDKEKSVHRFDPAIFCLLAAVWLIFRSVFFLTGSGDVLSFDEFELGTAAKELMSGLKFSYWQYQVDAYSGESLFLAPFTLIFFKLLGPNLFALKLTPLVFSFFVFILSVFFLNRYWGAKTAVIGGALLIFPPPSFLKLSVFALSGHTEILLLAVMMLLFFYEYHWGRMRRGVCLALFSFFAGFSVWVYYENLALVMACLAAGRVWDRNFFSRKNLAMMTFFSAIGFSPWVFYNLEHGFAGLAFFSQAMDVKEHGVIEMMRKGCGFLVHGLPFSFSTFDFCGISARNFSLIYGAFFLGLPGGLAISRFFRSRNEFFSGKSFLFCAYLFIFIFFYAVCPLKLQPELGAYGYRYLSPLFFFGCLFWGIELGAVSFNRAWFPAAVIALLGFAAQSSLYFKHPPAETLKYKGYSYYHYALPVHLAGSYQTFPFEDWARKAGLFGKEEQFYLYWGLMNDAMSFGQPYLLDPQGTPEAVLLNMPTESKPAFYQWMGAALGPESTEEFLVKMAEVPSSWRKNYVYGWALNHDPHIRDSALYASLPEGERNFYAMAQGEYEYAQFFQMFIDQPDFSPGPFLKIKKGESPEKRVWFLRGMGSARPVSGFYFQKDAHRALMSRITGSLGPADAAAVYWGQGWNIRALFREDRARSLHIIAALEPEERGEAMKGLLAYESFYDIGS